MNLRHAAALAPVGWYLTVPLPGNDPIPNAEAHSFSRWVHIASFDYAEKCEGARVNLIRAGVEGPQLGDYPEAAVKKALLLSESIASDDPHLKEK